MTFPEFLAHYFPTKSPKQSDESRVWAGWLANLYLAATGETITVDEAAEKAMVHGYVGVPDKHPTIIVSKIELKRADNKGFDVMFKNWRMGRGA